MSLRRSGPGEPQHFAHAIQHSLAFALLLILAGCSGGGSTTSSGGPPPPVALNFFRVVDASDFPNTLQYAADSSVVVKDGVYHVFFCSGGNIFPATDYIRYVKSTDGGKTWTTPIDMLYGNPTNGGCDPSVVLYHGFYYMFFGSMISTANLPAIPTQNCIEVARSANIDGPYLTYTTRGTWENSPGDPKMIILPLVPRSENPPAYGAGQPSVIVHNDRLYMWYTDDSQSPPVDGDFTHFRTFMLDSNDPVTWAPDPTRQINLTGLDSVDVKFDVARNQFVMWHVDRPFTQFSSLSRWFSNDGLLWTNAETLIASNQFPHYAHDVGVAGDETGAALTTQNLITFGAAADLTTFAHFNFDLIGIWQDPP